MRGSLCGTGTGRAVPGDADPGDFAGVAGRAGGLVTGFAGAAAGAGGLAGSFTAGGLAAGGFAAGFGIAGMDGNVT